MPVKKEKSDKKKATKKTVQKSTAKPAEAKTSAKGLKADIFDIKGKMVGSISLPSEVFGVKINNQLLAQAVRVYLANQRKGTASTKTRGEVQGSTRKIYKQKGTGRARHGSIRAPIFVKGGIVFGPKPRDYSLKFSKKMKKAALFSALSSKLKNKEIKVLTGLEDLKPKTKEVAQVLKNLDLSGKKILVVLPQDFENFKRAARNIKDLTLGYVLGLNTFEVLNNRVLIFTKESIEFIKKNFIKGE